MNEQSSVLGGNVIRVRREQCRKLLDHSQAIQSLFSARLIRSSSSIGVGDSSFVYFTLELQAGGEKPETVKVVHDVQNYVDSIVRGDSGKEDCDDGDFTSLCGEDSSYDSDFEGEETRAHEDVSRTVSDTLGAEFAEYVNSDYNARVGFALKLGYTEKQVQASLMKLGPNPGQNELLEELIKLGAQSPRLTDIEIEDAHDVAGVALNTSSKDAWSIALRPIVIDGSNVAMSHGNKEVFSCRGIKICVEWFRNRGHQMITVFVPKWRKEASKPDNPVIDQDILNDLEREGVLVYTPSRVVGGKRIICYDDRFILRLAVENDGIVVSNDNYRDLIQENADFKRVVEERTLMYSFVNDRFMPPDDPLGRSGPTLDNFLRMQPKKVDPPPPLCPYGRKCTYGNKCKYHHPERGPTHKSVTERLSEHAQRHWQARGLHSRDTSPGGDKLLRGKSLSVPLGGGGTGTTMDIRKMPLTRTRSGVPQSAAAGVSCTSASQHHDDRVSKSRSVENMRNIYYRQEMLPPHQHTSMLPPHTPKATAAAGPASDIPADNLHRKLQRQLTLNPSYDPRLFEMRLSMTGGNSNVGWEHASVTRIASAPDPPAVLSPPAYSPAISAAAHASLRASHVSASDPQLHLPSMVTNSHQQSLADARRKLHYHLASLFPEEQVLAAMQRYPDETKPQAICAAILAMFPTT